MKRVPTDDFISHADVRQEAVKLTGEPSITLLFRHLSASRRITIAQIEGPVRRAGSEFVLACDMRFARESVVFCQPEPVLDSLVTDPIDAESQKKDTSEISIETINRS